MRCVPSSCGSCSQVGQHSLMAPPPLREGAQPAALSTYSRFWAGGTPWRRFLLPDGRQGEAINNTKGEAGVYEFAVSMPQSDGTMVTVYVGKSSNVRSRHLAYLNTGSHLKEYLQPAAAQGCTVWQRVRYLDSNLQAERWEAKCLIDFDYAWNSDLNPPKRRIRLEHRRCCCMAVSVDVVDDATASRVAVLAAPLARGSAWTAMSALFLQLMLAVTIVAIVAERLATTAEGAPGSTQLSSQCLLGTDDQGQSLCVYSYIVAGSSMVVTLALALLMASSRKLCCASSTTVDAVVAVAMALWWAIAAIVLTRYQIRADDAGVAAPTWRHSVYIMAWVEAGLWALLLGVRVLLTLVGCCASRSRPLAEPSSRTGSFGGPPTAPTAPPLSPMAWEQQQGPPPSQFMSAEMRV